MKHSKLDTLLGKQSWNLSNFPQFCVIEERRASEGVKTKAMSMYQKGVGVLLGVLVGYLVGSRASYPRPSTKTASWSRSWSLDGW